MRRFYEEYLERYLPKFLVLLLYSSLTSILGIIISFLTFLPLIITLNHDHGVTISDESVDHLRDLLNSNLFVHTCIAALGCTFPLLCEHILDISMAKFKSTTIAQCCLILAIVVPSIVLYQASLYGHVTVGMTQFISPSNPSPRFIFICNFNSRYALFWCNFIISLSFLQIHAL